MKAEREDGADPSGHWTPGEAAGEPLEPSSEAWAAALRQSYRRTAASAPERLPAELEPALARWRRAYRSGRGPSAAQLEAFLDAARPRPSLRRGWPLLVAAAAAAVLLLLGRFVIGELQTNSDRTEVAELPGSEPRAGSGLVAQGPQRGPEAPAPTGEREIGAIVEPVASAAAHAAGARSSDGTYDGASKGNGNSNGNNNGSEPRPEQLAARLAPGLDAAVAAAPRPTEPSQASEPHPDSATESAAPAPSALALGAVIDRDDGIEFRRPGLRIVLVDSSPTNDLTPSTLR